ncbi:hypothetical protein SEA_WOOPER_30 [Gordonia phage Wooper]|nr:hypothetical protein SEA_WOOPER_30 [Gordonia phage Wooper]
MPAPDISAIVVTAADMEAFYPMNAPDAALWWSPKYEFCLGSWGRSEVPEADPESIYLMGWGCQEWWDQFDGDFAAAAAWVNSQIHVSTDDDLYG